MKKAYIYLDDIRPFPFSFVEEDYWVCTPKSVNAAIRDIELCERNGYKDFILDLDHDLGDYYGEGGDGVELVKWLIETGRNTENYKIFCHSMNPVGRENILALYKRYWKET